MKPATLSAFALAAGLALALSAKPVTAQTQAQPPLPTLQLTSGIHVITAEVAQTPDERATGLMFREQMAPNAGMLFAFAEPFAHCFWMRNTILPLSIAFVADDGTIVNIADMKPYSTDSHCAAKPVRFALEMNRGWFAKRGIKPGSKLRGAPFGS